MPEHTDVTRFEEYYNKLFNRIYRFITARTIDQQTAEDLTAQTFVKAWGSWPPRSFVEASIGSWTFRIARNVISDYYRKNSHNLTVPLDETITTETKPDGGYGQADEETTLKQIALQTALKKLAPKDQHLLLFRSKGYTNREIAQLLKMSEDAAAQAVYRALKRLKKQLG